MSQRYYSDWLKAFIEYGSIGEAPLKMLFWAGVGAIGGALRRRVWLDLKHFQWIPNFYIVFVAPPGVVAKSTTTGIAANLLREVPGIHFGPDVVTWQSLVSSFARAMEGVADPVTGEYTPMSALTLHVSEFGTFLNTQNKEMIDVLVALWDGQKGTFSKETKHSGSDYIENPCINILACTTPSWISENFPEYMIGGGFVSRCVFVYTDTKRQLVAYPDAPDDFAEQRRKLIHDLEIISQMYGEFRLSPEARQWGKDWYERHWSTQPTEMSDPMYAGYRARKQTHIHKLAMVIAASRSSETVLLPEHLEFAETMVTALETDMPKVFSRIGQSEIPRGAAAIVEIASRGPITRTDLYRQLFRTMPYKEFEEALLSAVNAGYVTLTQQGRDFVVAPKEIHRAV